MAKKYGIKTGTACFKAKRLMEGERMVNPAERPVRGGGHDGVADVHARLPALLCGVYLGEELFVTTLIAHLSTVFRAMKHGEFVKLEGLRKDVREFFTLPIPKAVWHKLKPLQDEKFAAFVEKCLAPSAFE